MNEQIKKLADEAARYSAVMALPTGESGDNLFVERFAELIVRECARVAMNTDLEDVEGGDSDVLYAAHTQIKQHFGVEE